MTAPEEPFSVPYWRRVYAEAETAAQSVGAELDFRSRNNYEHEIWRAKFKADHGCEPDVPFHPPRETDR